MNERPENSGIEQHLVDFLTELGAGSTPHSDSSLLVHLLGTSAILRAWRCPDGWSRAGLFHAVYGTSSFKTSLLEPTEANRAMLAKVIGAEAERLVFEYSTAREPPPLSTAVLHLAAANAAEQYGRLGWRCSEFLSSQARRLDLLPEARVFLSGAARRRLHAP